MWVRGGSCSGPKTRPRARVDQRERRGVAEFRRLDGLPLAMSWPRPGSGCCQRGPAGPARRQDGPADGRSTRWPSGSGHCELPGLELRPAVCPRAGAIRPPRGVRGNLRPARRRSCRCRGRRTRAGPGTSWTRWGSLGGAAAGCSRRPATVSGASDRADVLGVRAGAAAPVCLPGGKEQPPARCGPSSRSPSLLPAKLQGPAEWRGGTGPETEHGNLGAATSWRARVEDQLEPGERPAWAK